MTSVSRASLLSATVVSPSVNLCEEQYDVDVEDDLVDAETLAANQLKQSQSKPTVETITSKFSSYTGISNNATVKTITTTTTTTTTDDDSSSNTTSQSSKSSITTTTTPTYKTNEINNPVTGIYDEIEIEDMEFDTVKNIYTYPCPCGDRFVISVHDLLDGEDIARCPSCSLIIRVIYDDDLLDDLEEQQSEDDD